MNSRKAFSKHKILKVDLILFIRVREIFKFDTHVHKQAKRKVVSLTERVTYISNVAGFNESSRKELEEISEHFTGLCVIKRSIKIK